MYVYSRSTYSFCERKLNYILYTMFDAALMHHTLCAPSVCSHKYACLKSSDTVPTLCLFSLWCIYFTNCLVIELFAFHFLAMI